MWSAEGMPGPVAVIHALTRQRPASQARRPTDRDFAALAPADKIAQFHLAARHAKHRRELSDECRHRSALQQRLETARERACARAPPGRLLRAGSPRVADDT